MSHRPSCDKVQLKLVGAAPRSWLLFSLGVLGGCGWGSLGVAAGGFLASGGVQWVGLWQHTNGGGGYWCQPALLDRRPPCADSQ
ncbi:hypothetical protein E2562_001945 [Oryza meyeriana var. granulata]|uniref:Uncharacterized protein n=1 Tax=Oryza meyeriana var. granulata TaxID=110450 RepID=A0A6G1C3B0_9ORYZ|nr:hypothetical protein E2562_001945 [Oryza meyeriana var. granulata]